MTRARCTLAVSSIVPHRDAGVSWWQRLSGAATAVLPAAVSAVLLPTDAALADDSFNLPALPQLANLSVRSPVGVTDTAPTGLGDDPASRRVGLAMHRLLEWGGAASAAQCTAVAREFALSPAQTQLAAGIARRILTGDGAWAWQAERLGWQGNEVELMHGGQLLRLDRLVQRIDAGHHGHWWVLDYKSACLPGLQPALLAQMEMYRAAVQRAYPGASVQAAFLTGQGKMVILPPGPQQSP